MKIQVGDHVDIAPDSRYPYTGRTGEVTMLHENPDGQLNGIVRVKMTHPEARRGVETDVGARMCTVKKEQRS